MADKFTSGRIDTHEYIAKLKQSEATKATLSDVETLLASGDVDDIKADSIIENMTGYAGELQIPSNATNTGLYLGICKNGNKLTFVACGIINKNDVGGYRPLAKFYIPQSVNDKLVPFSDTKFDIRPMSFIANYETDTPSSVSSFFRMTKGTGTNPTLYLSADLGNLTIGTDYFYRIEATFLLSENLAPTE